MILNEKQVLWRLATSNEEDRLVITPILDPREQFQPSSVDLRLGTDFLTVKTAMLTHLDVLKDASKAEREAVSYTEGVHIGPTERFVLHPGEFALACTLEYVRLPSNLAARLEGKSTWGRLGLQIHSTAGFVDPGFEGSLTFELQNVGKAPIPLCPAMRVAQISFYTCERTSIPYNAKSTSFYGGRVGLMGSKYYNVPDARILRWLRDHYGNTR